MSKHTRFSLIPVLSLLLAACASDGGQRPAASQPPDTLQRIKDTLAETSPAPTPAPMPPAVSAALLPQLSTAGSAAAMPVEPRFDLDVDRVSAKAFFMGLVKDSRYNMVVHPDVTGDISLHLKKVTVADVMQVVRDVYGYEYEANGTGYVVLPARLQSRLFQVSYLNVHRSGESTTRVNSGQVSDTSADASDTSSGSVLRSIGSEIVTQNDADFWSELKATVQTIVGTEPGRSVVVSPQAGLVVVRAMPGELRDVEQFLSTAQRNLQRQVILEAKIVEVQLGDAFQAGINWAGLSEMGSDGHGFIGQGGVTRGTPGTPPIGTGGVFDPLSVVASGDEDVFDFAGLFTIGAYTDDFSALLNLLDTQGETNVLSSPRVSTINNQKAVIKVGSDEFFVTEVKSTTTTGSTTTTSPSITLTPFFSGIALDVTPQIDADGEVTLHIHPTVSEVRDQTKNITVAGETQSLPLAYSSVRESDSIVRARNGQVVVIGGLMQDRNGKDQGKTPWLGDLPLIGGLFRQERNTASRSELVILLRPIVIESQDTWNRALQDSSRRIEAMRPTMTESSTAKPAP